ncbi:WD40 domain containing protein [Pyrrhoderma noxium]|uniref:WD40 domain containing protein n=1 Tax=Pyrrhoderma noxium TaxID=2282107 RepID=A0A286UP25_9AGAM|nr:WD40 domain containing protein [Pyrrhoderma noxium]
MMRHYAFSTPIPPSSSKQNKKNQTQGNTRSVTCYNASSPGGSAISKSPDEERCVVAGKDSLRILRVSDGSERPTLEHKFAIGKGGYRIDVSKNFLSGSSLKADSALTDVVWCHKSFDNKILTSARNGDLILWDLNKSGSLKYERKTKGHTRSINKLSYSSSLPNLCCTGSSDGLLKVWDLRDLTKASHYVSNQFAVRTMLFTPSAAEPFAAISALDNGTICRWDLRMGQRGQLERIP